MLKTTPFTDIHIALGAKMAEFAGFNMPIQYPTGINQEHMIVREGVGVFDVSHMGEFWVKGEKALDFLQYITTNDLSVIPAGKCQYTCMPNGKGGIVDDLIIYKYSTTKYLMPRTTSMLCVGSTISSSTSLNWVGIRYKPASIKTCLSLYF
jgi:aminomethyltransferase